MIPLGSVAECGAPVARPACRTENATSRFLISTSDYRDRDLGGYSADARRGRAQEKVKFRRLSYGRALWIGGGS